METPNFTANNKTFCLSLHYNGDNSYLFVNVNDKEVINFKAKYSEIVPHPLCLGNISRNLNETTQTLDYLDMFMILVMIIGPLQMIKYYTFTNI